MFEHALDSSWQIRSRRRLTTLAAIAMQMLAVIILLVLPLLRPPGVSLFHEISTPLEWGRHLETHPFSSPGRSSGAHRMFSTTSATVVLRPPSRIPKGIQAGGEDTPPQIGDAGPAISSSGNGSPSGIANLFGSGSRILPPAVQPPASVAPVRISHMSEGNLIRKVQPVYPALARSSRVQGTVVLQAVISKDGSIENLRLLSGHPMLAPSAIEAVRQWRYRPYILNGKPVEVETQITVNFSLQGN